MMKPNCEKDMLMLRVQSWGFAFLEAALYLDTHPCDNAAQAQAAEFYHQYCKAVELYNEKVGPLTTGQAVHGDGWSWVECTWPWQLV